MSKTIASVLCETNQVRGLPQENVFIQNLYRFPSDYNAPFQRSATSTAPVQICAVASAQGDDTIGAMALQEVMKILSGMTAQAQTRSVLDFDTFTNQFLAAANTAICNLTVSNHGAPVRVSVTILFIEGDTMRIVSVGNTRAVLVRQNRVINLTDDQTVAHRYVQMGAITAEAEITHPERTVLTQYIGKFPQDGPVLPEKQIYMKISDGDVICLLGTGITQGLSDYTRNSVLIKTVSPEEKANELVGRCVQNNIKGGLSVLILRVESTLLMPAGAFAPGMASTMAAAGATAAAVFPEQRASEAAAVPSNQPPDSAVYPNDKAKNADNSSGNHLNPNERSKAGKKARNMAIIRPIAVFLGCVLAGYLGVMLLFNVGNLFKPSATPATDSNGSTVVNKVIKYVNAEMVAVYPDPSLNNEPTVYLSRGDVVTIDEVSGSFTKVLTIDGVSGYIVSTMLSDTDPTIGESQAEMSADPTPIPSKQQTAAATSAPAETVPPETTTLPSETVPTTAATTSVTPDPSATTGVTPDPSATVPTAVTSDTSAGTPTDTAVPPPIIPVETVP